MTDMVTSESYGPEQDSPAGLLRAPKSSRTGLARRGLRANAGLIAGVALLLILVAASLLATTLRPYSPTEIAGVPFSSPSAAHWLGTDDLGRDTFVRVCVAARASLLISFLAAAIAAVVGSAIGVCAGMRGGRADSVLMAVMDLVLAIPSVLVALCAVTAFGASELTLIVVLGIVGIPAFARLVRARCAELRHEDFVLSARVSGVSGLRIAFRHMLPNCGPVIAVQAANTAAVSVLLEAALSYLGLSVQPPTPSWGYMIYESQNFLQRAPWLAIAPAIAILMASVGWGLIGDAFSRSRRSTI